MTDYESEYWYGLDYLTANGCRFVNSRNNGWYFIRDGASQVGYKQLIDDKVTISDLLVGRSHNNVDLSSPPEQPAKLTQEPFKHAAINNVFAEFPSLHPL